MNLLQHYKKLIYFNFNRFKGDNYKALREYYANILISETEEFMPMANKRVLDVGGSRGEFCDVLSNKRQCSATNLDPEPREHGLYHSDFLWPKTTVGFADNMPFADKQFDLVICRGVLEHVPNQDRLQCLYEINRVLKDTGLLYLMIPPWYNPHAGHQLKPFHILPFKIAKFLKQAFVRHKIEENSVDEMRLYPITFRRMSIMLKQAKFHILDTKDMHFRLHFLTKMPIIREMLVPSVVFIAKNSTQY